MSGPTPVGSELWLCLAQTASPYGHTITTLNFGFVWDRDCAKRRAVKPFNEAVPPEPQRGSVVTDKMADLQ